MRPFSLSCVTFLDSFPLPSLLSPFQSLTVYFWAFPSAVLGESDHPVISVPSASGDRIGSDIHEDRALWSPTKHFHLMWHWPINQLPWSTDWSIHQLETTVQNISSHQHAFSLFVKSDKDSIKDNVRCLMERPCACSNSQVCWASSPNLERSELSVQWLILGAWLLRYGFWVILLTDLLWFPAWCSPTCQVKLMYSTIYPSENPDVCPLGLPTPSFPS